MAYVINPQGQPVLTPEMLQRQRALSTALLQQSQDNAPIESWTQGAAKLAQALMGGYMSNKADQREADARKSAGDDFSHLFGGAMDGADSPVASTSPESLTQPADGASAARDMPPPAAVPEAAPAAHGGTPGMAELVQAANNPWLSDAQKQIIGVLMNRELAKLEPQSDDLMSVGKDSAIYNKSKGTWIQPPAGIDTSAPTVHDFYDPKTGQPYGAQWNPQTQVWDQVGGVKAEADASQSPPSGYRWNADHTQLEVIPGGPAATENDAAKAPAGYRLTVDGTSLEPIPGGPADPHGPASKSGNIEFDNIAKLRTEVQGLPSYKNFAQAAPVYRAMAATAGTNSKASDLDLVYGLGKIFDPNSVVREGEMVMVRNSASLPDWVVGAINSLDGGQALTPETRKAILKEARGRLDAYRQGFEQDASQYRDIATRYGFNPDDILPKFGEFPEPSFDQPPPADALVSTVPLGTKTIIDGVTIERVQ